MELRGEVRGGRFVGQVSGEQYALPEAVERLREARDETDAQRWTVISAADPINLFGVLTDGAAVPATHRNALVVRAVGWWPRGRPASPSSTSPWTRPPNGRCAGQ